MNQQLFDKVFLQKLFDISTKKGFVLFPGAIKDYDLNIWGIRSANKRSGKYDDLEVVFWYYNGVWIHRIYSITTDPGKEYLKEPLNSKGTAILKEGQWRGMWAEGLHQGKYPALVQVKPVTVVRDFNRDEILDLDSGVEEKGLFGINNHRASINKDSDYVGKYSAGCQVFQYSKDFFEFMDIIGHAKEIWGNSFTYTLINENDL